MKKIIITAIALLLGICFSGCKTPSKTFTYPANRDCMVQLSDTPLLNKKVIVLPFEDLREEENTDWMPLAFFPGFPYGWSYHERPEFSRGMIFSPELDLASAAAISLQHSKLFKQVIFSPEGEYDEADFILGGRLKSTRFKNRLFMYGISLYGVYSWWGGLPINNFTTTLELELFLKKNNKIIWQYSFSDWTIRWRGVYYNWNVDECYDYISMMQDCMNQAILEMKEQIPRFHTFSLESINSW